MYLNIKPVYRRVEHKVFILGKLRYMLDKKKRMLDL